MHGVLVAGILTIIGGGTLALLIRNAGANIGERPGWRPRR
jgi:hypothetical protein